METKQPPAPHASPTPAEDRHTVRDSSPRIHLLLGPVGAGKSTLAFELAREHGAVRLTLDEWMTKLFARDRPEHGAMDWYVERAARCLDMIWAIAAEMIDRNTSVILEIGLLRRREREAFYDRVDAVGARLTVYVLDASRDERRRRVEDRNRRQGPTFSMNVPPAIFELASDLWEPIDTSECEARDVRFVQQKDR